MQFARPVLFGCGVLIIGYQQSAISLQQGTDKTDLPKNLITKLKLIALLFRVCL